LLQREPAIKAFVYCFVVAKRKDEGNYVQLFQARLKSRDDPVITILFLFPFFDGQGAMEK
jgi:hypothetical protein